MQIKRSIRRLSRKLNGIALRSAHTRHHRARNSVAAGLPLTAPANPLAMGCAPSKRLREEAETEALAEPAPHARPNTHKPVAKANSKAVYETATSASVVAMDKGVPVFHGLLSGRSRPLLQYEQATRDAPSIAQAVAPTDDSFAPPLGYDPQYGVLAVSDVVMTLKYTVIVTDSPEREGAVRKIVHDVLDVVHSVVNGWSDTSEITALNQAKPERPVQCSDAMCMILDIVDELHDLTDGRFDPTTGVIKLAYDESLHAGGRPPLPNELARFRFATGWKKRILRNNTEVTKQNANTIIDLDGLSKGFCIDLIAEALHFEGYRTFYIDWAGDIRAVGKHPSGRPWRTAVLTPPALPRLFKHWRDEKLDEMLGPTDLGYLVDLVPDYRGSSAVIDRVGGLAIATSGDYFQIRKYGFHHIIAPGANTAMKAAPHSVASVSIMASTCAFADGIATAAMTFSTPDEAVTFLERIQKRVPNKFFGFCVLGRSCDAHSEKYRTHHFRRQDPIVDDSSDVTESRPAHLTVPQVKTSKDDMARIMGAVVRTPGRLSWGSESVNVDSLIPCSMNPEPKVSFILPKKLANILPVFSEDEEVREGAMGIDQLRFGYEDQNGKSNTVALRLSISEMFPCDDATLVIARVEECFQGGAGVVRFFLGGFPHTIVLRPLVSRDDFLYRPVVEQAKEVFSELPSTVCVISTTAADGDSFGLTATSLVISEHVPNTFCFNVMHSSTFFAAFGGLGSNVTVYCLDAHSDKLAKMFASYAMIKPDTKALLAQGSMCIMKGVVKLVETVEDHALVVSELRQSAFSSEITTPLIWHRRRYTFFDNP